MNFEEMYQASCTKRSDINKHVPTLYAYGSKCKHVTEMGVRSGISTTAFLHANPDTLISYDLKLSKKVDSYFDYAKKIGKNYTYIAANVLDIEIEPTDLLFIDTLHNYTQIKQELKLHAEKVRKYIAFHDVESWGLKGESYTGETNVVGILPAINEFLAEHPEWKVVHHVKYNSGFMVIERQD